MTRIWCEHAWLGGDRVTAGVVLGIDGGRIETVEPGIDTAPADAVALRGYTLPGLANAHSHAFQRAFRGATEAGRGTFWTWREQMYEAAARLDPDSYFALARATFGEMALAGVTAVGEFHYVHHAPDGTPYADPNAMGAAVTEAAREAGIRITLLDTCYLHGGIGKVPGEGQRRFSDGTVERWVERVDALESGATVRLGAAIHSVRAVDPRSAATVAEWAAARDVPLHAHLSEQPLENEDCRRAYGSSPTEVLSEAGALAGRFTAVHATHLTDADRRLLGAARACCCLCPTTERDLADGIGAAAALRESGASLALGSDSQVVIDLFEEARAMELDERLAELTRGNQSAAQLLAAATVEGHRAIGWPEAGAIVEGGLADFVHLACDGVRLAGIDPDHALASIVFAAGAADVTNVIVGGEFVVRDGRHLKLDVASELRDSIADLRARP